MRSRTRALAAALLAACAWACAPSGLRAPVAADAQIAFAPCADSNQFACGHLTVPLDPSGATPGTVTLAIRRHRAPVGEARSAIIALAGGPGQPALPFAEDFTELLGPIAATRDLIVFDQRGIGLSDPLSCHAFEHPGLYSSFGKLIEACGSQMGAARSFYTTANTVADIEAIRRAGGYEKLVLYGTSYGTKVALEYAERYPQNVEALVLDSVVPVEGPEPFAIPTFQAISGVLGELCERGACAGVTANPVGDVATLATQLRRRALSGSVYDGSGKRHAATIDEQGLLDILVAGDLNPALRALLPAAVTSALRHDPDPLLRLHLLSEGLIPSVPIESGSGESSQQVDEALFATTTCEETPFPWQRSAPQSTRLSEALGYLNAQPASDFYPFDASTAYANSLVGDCAAWPDASPPPPAPSALPGVPTLILSGEQDLRTPTADARRVAAQIPGAQLVVVPFTGHSVLGSDLSDCSALAVKDFFSSTAVQPCPADTVNQFAPTPVTPTKLAYIRPPAGLAGRPGKTLVAALDTLVDLNRQVIAATLQADEELPSGSSFGGLRGGYAKLTASAAILRGFSFVPGVQLTATFPVRDHQLRAAEIRVSGAQASTGTVRFGASSKFVTGTLGGRRFDVNLAKVRLSRVGAASGEWPALGTLDGLLARRAPWLR